MIFSHSLLVLQNCCFFVTAELYSMSILLEIQLNIFGS